MNALDNISTSNLVVCKSQSKQEERFDEASDISVWTAFKAGDKSAFEFMFRSHYELLLNYGLKLNRDEDDVKDYIQQLFSKLWESRLRLCQNNSIKGYLLASLRRMMLRGSKKQAKFLEMGSLTAQFHLHLAVENRFFKNERERIQIEYLNELLKSLPRRQKEAIYLKYYGEHRFAEIAEIMGISTRVVYKLVYKAMANLSEQVKGKQQHLEMLIDGRSN